MNTNLASETRFSMLEHQFFRMVGKSVNPSFMQDELHFQMFCLILEISLELLFIGGF
jgi:hypothetical protein